MRRSAILLVTGQRELSSLLRRLLAAEIAWYWKRQRIARLIIRRRCADEILWHLVAKYVGCRRGRRAASGNSRAEMYGGNYSPICR